MKSRNKHHSMNVRAEILKEHSKKQTMKIVHFVGNDKKKFSGLMTLFLGNEYRITQRSAWAVSYCVKAFPSLILPYIEKMIRNTAKQNLHVAVKRNTVKILEDIAIPEKFTGLCADMCFSLLASKTETLAVKVYSMSVLAKICKKEPGLKNELKLIVEEQLPYSTAGFRTRAKRVFSELEKI